MTKASIITDARFSCVAEHGPGQLCDRCIRAARGAATAARWRWQTEEAARAVQSSGFNETERESA